MDDRDCSGYGVYEGTGAALSFLQSPPPAPSSLMLRLAAQAPAPPAALLTAGQAATAPRLFFPLPRSSQMAVKPLVRAPLRGNFRLVAQPVRRRVAVPLPMARLAAPASARAAAATLVPKPSVPVFFGVPSSQQVMTVTLPGIPALPGMPSLGFTQHGNLWMVDPTQTAAVATILGGMSYTPFDVPDVDSVGAKAEFMMGQIPAGTDAWTKIQLHASQGFATMIEKASVVTGVFNLLVTQSPTVIAQLAGGPNATHALVVDQPSTLIDQADASLNPAPPGPGQKETGTCPPGTTGAPPDCIVPGGTQQASIATPDAAAPSWWQKLSSTEKAVGIGAVGLVAVALYRASTTKKR